MLEVFSTENVSIHHKIVVAKTGIDHNPPQTTTTHQETTTNHQKTTTND